ncbi:MAG: L-threonylcarbamoyladenylate synthase [Rhodothermales bacterium]
MHTLLTTSPNEAAALLRAGEVVAFPTETVYGLGADAFNAEAVRHLFEAKGRPTDNPLIVHIAHLDQITRVASEVSPSARKLITSFFPGPLTLILPKTSAVPGVVTGGLDTVGVRMPRHPVAQAFLEACGGPVAAPSANRSGRPSPTTWQAVHADLDGRIACILKGDRSEAGLESTVVDCTAPAPVVLRTGVITVEQLRMLFPEVQTVSQAAHEPARSPGTRYRHYAPRARVQLVTAPEEAVPGPDAAFIGLAPVGPDAFGLSARCATVEHYAYDLFDFFRRCDAAGVRTIFCQRVAPEGLGRALMDRLHRAAQR